jgi:hypothetical protein
MPQDTAILSAGITAENAAWDTPWEAAGQVVLMCKPVHYSKE